MEPKTLSSKARQGLAIAIVEVKKAIRQSDTAPAVWGFILFFCLLVFVEPIVPVKNSYSSAIYAKSGELLAAKVSRDGQWHFEKTNAVPELYTSLLLEFEDKRFYGHTGFDPLSIARALYQNTKSKTIISGASTISMQVARLRASQNPLGQTRNIRQKILELWSALRLEMFYTKDEIIGFYSDLAPYGANVIGLNAASFRWFARPMNNLSIAEAACLAILPNNPAMIHIGRSREALKLKRDNLLQKLVLKGRINKDDYEAAIMEPLPSKPKPMPDFATQLLAKTTEGDIITTLDYNLQLRVLDIVARHGRNLSRSKIQNIAVIVMNVDDASILAYVGNRPMDGLTKDEIKQISPWVDCAAAPRSSGSILKPFLYAAMLDSGELLPTQLIPDIPTRIGSYSPENNLKTYSGAVPADEALAKSLNVPFVRLLRQYGIERFASMLNRLGFTTLTRAPSDYGLTLILGGAEVNLREAAAAYSFMARTAKGNSQKPFLGSAWNQNEFANMKYIDPPFSRASSWLTLSALINVGRPNEEASWKEYATARRIAWKTGTSFGSRDAWAIGTTSSYTVAVWTGNADGIGRPEIKGSEIAAPLLFDIFDSLPRSPWFEEPLDDMRYETICLSSGYIANQNCETTKRILVPRSEKAGLPCPYCKLVYLSRDEKYQVKTELAGSQTILAKKFFVLPPSLEWYYAKTKMDYKKLPPFENESGASSNANDTMDFITPEQGASIYIPIELDGKEGQTVFRAVHRNPKARIFWHLDDTYICETKNDHRIEIRPEPGRHSITIVDDTGVQLQRFFTVYDRN